MPLVIIKGRTALTRGSAFGFDFGFGFEFAFELALPLNPFP
jgi:hypothetical protein